MRFLIVALLALPMAAQTIDAVRQLKNVAHVDVRTYGAKGDGTTNDTTAIQNAINAASTSGKVVIPAGTYKITSMLTIPRNLVVEGAGADNTILSYTTNTGVAILHADNGSPITYYPRRGKLSNLRISGPGAATVTVGIWQGGDPANTISPTTHQGHRMDYERIEVRGFGRGFVQGENAYNHDYHSVYVDYCGVGYDAPTTTLGNSGAADRWFGGLFLGNSVAAFRLNGGYLEVSLHATGIEYNKHGFSVLSYGGIISAYGVHWETYSDNNTAAGCASLDVCGEFIYLDNSFGSAANVQITISGGLAYYASDDVQHTSMFNLSPAAGMTLKVSNLAAGWANYAGSYQLTQVFAVTATAPYVDSVFADVSMAKYDRFGSTNILVPYGSMARYWVTDTNGNKCYNCEVPGYTLDLGVGSAQYADAPIRIRPSTHASSRRASFTIDNWSMFQDISGNGTKDFGFYNAAAAGYAMRFSATNTVTINKPVLTSVPTSCSGAASGTVWNDAGTLKICP